MNTPTNTAHSLQAGTAAIAITPPVGVAMQGYGRRRARGIADPIFATGLAIYKDRLEWLLLSVDVIGLDRSFTNRVRRSIARRLRISPSIVTIICSHTHSGPATLPRLGVVRGERSYLRFLESKLVAVAESATAQFQPVRLRFGMTSLSENVNRRLRVGDHIELGVDSAGPVDERVRVVRLDKADGTNVPVALLVHYACHATTSGGVTEISADWPGAMRNHVCERYPGNDKPTVLFLQGCTGNLTHRIGRDTESWPDHFGQETTVQSQALGRAVGQAAIQASEDSKELDAVDVEVGVKPVSLPFHNRTSVETSEVQVARIGPGRYLADTRDQAVWFVGLPGEPFTEYSTDFGREFQRYLGASPDRTLVCGYTNDCVGYFCTEEALQEGGYESASAHRMYHRPAPFSGSVQSILRNHCLNAAQDLHLKSPEPLLSWKEVVGHWANRTVAFFRSER